LAEMPREQFWGAQAASLQVSAACREREIASISNGVREAVAGRAAGNYRFATANPSRGGLAACAPPELPRHLSQNSNIAVTFADKGMTPLQRTPKRFNQSTWRITRKGDRRAPGRLRKIRVYSRVSSLRHSCSFVWIRGWDKNSQKKF